MAKASGARIIGGALVVPALVVLVLTYGVPAVRTIWRSLSEPGRVGAGGLDNYDRIGSELMPAIGWALLLGLGPLLVVLLVAPMIAEFADAAGRAGRWTARLALVLPVVCFAPGTVALAWADETGHPPTAPIFWLATFGLACGVGLTVYLAALRRPRATVPASRRWQVAAVAAGLLGLGTLAAALQIASPFVINPDSDPGAPTTPLAVIVNGLADGPTGEKLAASVVLLLLVGLLGVAATVVVILTGLRVELDPRGRSAPTAVARQIGLAVTIVAAVLVLVITVSGLRPWLVRAGRTDGLDELDQVDRILANTWVPPLITTVVAVLLALVAAFGIGALRPFGRHSELLLLPFAPFLFVGTGPLLIDRITQRGPVGPDPTLLDLLPPAWIAVPALVVFTVAVRGQWLRHAPDRPAAYARQVVLPVLPLVLVVAGAMWVVQAQDQLWGVISARSAELVAAPTALYYLPELRESGAGFGLPLPLAAVAALAAVFGILQILYLDRLTIHVGRPPRPGP